MPETLILHLGLHKTATTALQEFLAGEVEGAARARRRLPAAGADALGPDAADRLGGQARPRRARALRRARCASRCCCSRTRTSSARPGDIVGGALYPYAENRLRRFCDQFAGRRIRLFLTLREPAAFLASMYCEYLRHNPYLGFADYARGFDLDRFAYAAGLRLARRAAAPRRGHGDAVRGRPRRRGAGDHRAAARGGLRTFATASTPAASPRPARGPPTASRSWRSPRRSPGAPTRRPRSIFLNLLDSRDRRFGATRFEPLPPERAAALAAHYDRDLAAFAGLRAA